MLKAKIKICQSIKEAPTYREPEYQGAIIEEYVIVKNGTKQGKPTIDIIFKDKNGQKFAVLSTGDLLKGVVAALNGCEHH